MSKYSDLSAFPTAGEGSGMNMREYFAGQAIVGLLSNPKIFEYIMASENRLAFEVDCAANAWGIADAMIREGNKP